MRNNFILLVFAILSFGLLFWVKSSDQEDLRRKKLANHKPQEYMRHAFVTIFSESGSLKNELSAKYWAYLPDAELSILTLPHLSIYKPDGSIWLIDAKKGRVKQPTIGNIEQLELQDEVVIERPETKTTIPLKLETTELNYYPKKEFAESEQWVVMNKPGLKMTGVGLRAYLNQGSMELLRDVKTYYTVTR